MKKFLSTLLVFCLLLTPVVSNNSYFVESDFSQNETEIEEVYANYIIYDENGEFLTEKRGVSLGDLIIDSKFNEYEITFIDDELFIATATYVRTLEKPKIRKSDFQNISEIEVNKTIGMYSTHNDESYIIGDGKESVYGEGGIHDIANQLAENLRKKKLNVKYDETLHIPHDSSAYSRSRKTANKLLQDGASAIFDIHRDGASRSFYLTENNGKKYSKVRIVVGQGNANKEANLQLALWMVGVSEKLYPWLIADIYYGNGKYNQDLTSKALLFEMGCHKIEKEYVKNSVPALADVIFTTLYGTTVEVEEESVDLNIGGNVTEQSVTVDEYLEMEETKNYHLLVVVSTIVTVIIAGGIIWFVVRKKT